jgi:hypothetical protein
LNIQTAEIATHISIAVAISVSELQAGVDYYYQIAFAIRLRERFIELRLAQQLLSLAARMRVIGRLETTAKSKVPAAGGAAAD